MAWKEYYVYDFTNTALTGGSLASPVFVETNTRTDSDADYELMKRTHIATNDQILVRYRDNAYGRFLQSTNLDLRTVSGTILASRTGIVQLGMGDNNFMPYVLTRPFLIRAATTFTAEFADFSGSSNSIRQAFHGAKVRQGKAPWDEQWKATPYFDYATGPLTCGANATISFSLNVNIDSHFLIRRLTATRDGACLITLKDGATERQWMNTSIHIDNLFGTAQFPNILPAPRFIWRGSVINITIQDLSGASNNIQMTFSGEKLY